jgi:hypothetical protein
MCFGARTRGPEALPPRTSDCARNEWTKGRAGTANRSRRRSTSSRRPVSASVASHLRAATRRRSRPFLKRCAARRADAPDEHGVQRHRRPHDHERGVALHPNAGPVDHPVVFPCVRSADSVRIWGHRHRPYSVRDDAPFLIQKGLKRSRLRRNRLSSLVSPLKFGKLLRRLSESDRPNFDRFWESGDSLPRGLQDADFFRAEQPRDLRVLTRDLPGAVRSYRLCLLLPSVADTGLKGILWDEIHGLIQKVAQRTLEGAHLGHLLVTPPLNEGNTNKEMPDLSFGDAGRVSVIVNRRRTVLGGHTANEVASGLKFYTASPVSTSSSA